MILADGFYWPEADRVCRPITMAGLANLERAIEATAGRGVALQAGGCVGVWAARLAEAFEAVHTVEPDAENLACLRRNVPGNVKVHAGALGAERGRAGLVRYAPNAGGHYLRAGDEVRVLTLDSLKLPRLDLLALDVEGSEMAAILGGRQTILRHRPVVMFEERGHGARYGVTPGAVEGWFAGAGYAVAARFEHDILMVPA